MNSLGTLNLTGNSAEMGIFLIQNSPLMPCFRGWFIVVLALFGSSQAHGQRTAAVDSLQGLLRKDLPDSVKVDVYISLHRAISDNDSLTALYIGEAIKLSEGLDDPKRISWSYLRLARDLDYAGDMGGARSALARVGEQMQYFSDSRIEATFFMQTGIIDYLQGTYDSAVTNLWNAVRLYEELGDSVTVASCLMNIGNSYRELKKYDESLEYYQRSLVTYNNSGYEIGAAMAYGNMGYIYKMYGDYDKALEYYHKSLEVNEKNNYRDDARIDLNNIGLVFMEKREYDTALKYLNNALDIATSIGSDHGIAGVGYNIGLVRSRSGEYTMAINKFNEVLALASVKKFRNLIMDSYQGLSDAYAGLGQYRKALEYRKTFEIWKDSLMNENHLNQVKEQELKYETEKKDERIQLLAKEKALQENEVKRQATLKRAFIGGLVLVALLAGLIAYTLRQRLKNQKLLAAKNEEIREMDFKHQMSELEIKALRAQINPHFLFNCMNSINRMILDGDNDNASLYLTKFSRLVRLILENTERSSVSLQNELALLESYIQLESLRFKGRIDYKIHVDDSVDPDSTYLPSMVLQPFVENAIWHGLMHKTGEEKGIIDITVKEIDGRLHCVIEDNGVGREKARELQQRSVIKSKSMGMQITEERLRLLSKDQWEKLINITDMKDSLNRAMGTRVEIDIPVS